LTPLDSTNVVGHMTVSSTMASGSGTMQTQSRTVNSIPIPRA